MQSSGEFARKNNFIAICILFIIKEKRRAWQAFSTKYEKTGIFDKK
jgi:hypothetical protein